MKKNVNKKTLSTKRDALLRELEAVEQAIGIDDPYSHPGRYDKSGMCVDMTGQPKHCEECGAPYKAEGGYLLCTENTDHWRGIVCTEEVRQAIVERWGKDRKTNEKPTPRKTHENNTPSRSSTRRNTQDRLVTHRPRRIDAPDI